MLASDFAFREAVATGDVATLLSALENQGARIKAQAVLYVDLQGQVIADTLRPGAAPRPFELPELIAQARVQGGATTIELLDQHAVAAGRGAGAARRSPSAGSWCAFRSMRRWRRTCAS